MLDVFFSKGLSSVLSAVEKSLYRGRVDRLATNLLEVII
jgi:hypothetical protein